MQLIENGDNSNITVQVHASHRHNWVAGQHLHHDPSVHSNSEFQFQLWLVQQGQVDVQANGQKWSIGGGEVFCLPVSLERDIFTPEPSAWLSLRLWISVFNSFELMQDISLPALWRPDASDYRRLKSWMEIIDREFREVKADRRLLVEGLAQAILGLCWSHLTPVPLATSVHSGMPPWLGETLRQITQDPTCSIAGLARKAGFSPAQFRRAFFQRIGISPRDYLKTKRLELACHFLERTDLPVRVIALRIGLRNATYFSQVFRSVYGCSPSQYRASVTDNEERKTL